MDEKLRSHFLSLYCMVVADGDVAMAELKELYRIANEDFKLTEKEINDAIMGPGTAFYIPDNKMDRIKYLYDLALIAAADGKIDDSERVLLKEYALKFGFLEENVNDLADLLLDLAMRKTPVSEILKNVE